MKQILKAFAMSAHTHTTHMIAFPSTPFSITNFASEIDTDKREVRNSEGDQM